MDNEASSTQIDAFVRDAATLLAQEWDDLAKFCEAFNGVILEAVASNVTNLVDVEAAVQTALAREHGKNLITRMGEIASWAQRNEEGQRYFWDFFHAFCTTLPRLSFNPETLAAALEPVLLVAAGDMAGGAIYKAVQDLAKQSRETAECLFAIFGTCATSPVASLAADSLIGLAQFDLPAAHQQALLLTHATEPLLRRAGLGALSSLEYSEGTSDLLSSTMRRFEEIRAEPNQETDDVLARAYGLLIGRAEGADSAFVELAKRPETAVKSQVAYILLRRADSDHREPWHREALLFLADISSSQSGILRYLDQCATRYARDKSRITTTFLEVFVKGRDYGREGPQAKLTNLLGETIGLLRTEAPAVLEEAITQWFTSSDRRLHQAAADLVAQDYRDAPMPKLPATQLSKPVLDSLNEPTLSLLLRRILGYVIGGRPLAALIASVLRREPISPPLGSLVEEALGEYVLYNYPGSAAEYLNACLVSDEFAEPAREVLRKALARSEAYFSALKDLPRLNELRPPSQRMARLWLAKQKFHSSIMDAARKRSPIMSLMPHVSLKFGASFFTESEGTFTEPTVLGTLSHSVEFARGETIDPLGQQLLRLQWRTAGLQEEQGESET